MKKKVQFLYPAIFIKDEDGSCQVVFPDLNLSTDGKDMPEAYLSAKDMLYVYFSYVMKYETEFNSPSKLENIRAKCRANEVAMYIDAVVETEG